MYPADIRDEQGDYRSQDGREDLEVANADEDAAREVDAGIQPVFVKAKRGSNKDARRRCAALLGRG